jgi:hypothetical protein
MSSSYLSSFLETTKDYSSSFVYLTSGSLLSADLTNFFASKSSLKTPLSLSHISLTLSRALPIILQFWLISGDSQSEASVEKIFRIL